MDNDFDFAAASADMEADLSPFARLVSVIEATGRKVVVGQDQMIAVNEHNEISFFAGMVEHNGEVCLSIPRTKWFAKMSDWLAEDDTLSAYTERTGPGHDFRVYVS